MSYSFEKNADTEILYPASLIKLLTAIVARQWVSDADLQSTVLVKSEDMHPPTTAGIMAGDIISWQDLMYGLLVPSGNDASLTIGRVIGNKILESEAVSGGDGVTRFIQEMNNTLQNLGFVNAVAGSTHGVDNETKLSAKQVSALLIQAASDPFLKNVMGTMTRTITITGDNQRTYDLTHTIKPYLQGFNYIPEFVCGKTGTQNSGNGYLYSLAVIWSDVENVESCSVVLCAPGAEDRYKDMRKIIDYEKNLFS